MLDHHLQSGFSKKLESPLALGLACLASISFPLIAGCRTSEDNISNETARPAIQRRLENFDERSTHTPEIAEAPEGPAPAMLPELLKVPEAKAFLVYNGRETQFTAAQAPELFSQCQRLADNGIAIVVVRTNENSLAIKVCDRETNYECSRSFLLPKQELLKVTREKAPLPGELKEFLDSFTSRGSLLIDAGDDVSSAFYKMTLEGASLIPDEAVTFLMRDGWIVSPKHALTPHALMTEKGLEQRMPSGRCIFADKRIELAEYFNVNASVRNASVASLYHEIGHAIFSRHIEADPALKQRLAMALERDLNQLGDLSLHKDAADPELSLKLSYYGTVSEGFAESYKNMLCPSLGRGGIMVTHFPALYSACQDIISQVLKSREILESS